MEIKTLEEYVIHQLEEKDNKLAEQEQAIQYLNTNLNNLWAAHQNLKALVYSLSEVSDTSEAGQIVYFKSIYEKFDTDKYETLKALMPEIFGITPPNQ